MNVSLNGEWTLNIDNEEYLINIPSAIQSLPELGAKFPCEAMPNSFLGKALLTKTFKCETPKKINTVTFKGIMPYGAVYINGNEVGAAQWCQTAFTFEIGKYLKAGENTISVVIEEENLEYMGGMRFDLLKWSGIYDDVYLSTGDIEIKEAEIKYNPENSKAVIKAYISENGVTASLSVALGDESVITQTAVSSDNSISFEIDTSSLEKWSTFNPVLYDVKIKADGEELKFATGFRDFRCENDRLLLNGVPFYAFGGGDEYFSPTISPLMDKEIIRKRYSKIKEMGFNFYRFHTHSPTDAELEVCDGLGIAVSVEIPILSNFNRISNTEVGLKILTEYIKQTRTHPCIVDYCLGNEGVQLLVKSKEEHKIAIDGYKTVKENTDYQLAMMCFGYQGEVPELNNDIMTPHLWSHEFRWAYQGLAKTPWSFIKGTLSNKPCIVHEFGKYGVWPDDEEDSYCCKDITVENNIFSECQAAVVHGDAIWRNPSYIDENSVIYDRLINQVKINEPPYSECYPELSTYFEDKGKPVRNLFANNIVYRCLNALAMRHEEHWYINDVFMDCGDKNFREIILDYEPWYDQYGNYIMREAIDDAENWKNFFDEKIISKTVGFKPFDIDRILRKKLLK